MPNPFNFTILDTSPIFQYYPSQDGPITTSWNATFSGSEDSTWVPQSYGVGASSHRTTLIGASVRLDWLGTAIYLYGNASAGAYTINLDGTQASAKPDVPGLLFAQSGLTYGSHSLTLAVVQATSTTSISSAIISVGMGETGTTIQNYTIDTLTVPLTSNGIVLSGTWYQYQASYGIGGPYVPRLATNVNGSSISFPIASASAFYINGHVNFDHGPYRVTLTPPADLGPPQTVHYNGSSRWVGLNTFKYLATGLDRTRTYYVKVTNEADLYYDQSQIVVFDTPPSSSPEPNPGSTSGSNSPPASAIAGGVVGCIFLFLSIILIVIFFLRRRKQQTTQTINQTDGTMVPHNFLPAGVTASNVPMSTPWNPVWPNTRDGLPNLNYPTTDFRPAIIHQPLHPDSMTSQHPTTAAIINQPLHSESIISQSQGSFSDSSPTSFSISPASPPNPIPHGLSQEDARFFNNLYALNVPATEIATMMEALRAEREAANLSRMDGSNRGLNMMEGSSRGGVRVEPEAMGIAPPRYDFKG